MLVFTKSLNNLKDLKKLFSKIFFLTKKLEKPSFFIATLLLDFCKKLIFVKLLISKCFYNFKIHSLIKFNPMKFYYKFLVGSN